MLTVHRPAAAPAPALGAAALAARQVPGLQQRQAPSLRLLAYAHRTAAGCLGAAGAPARGRARLQQRLADGQVVEAGGRGVRRIARVHRPDLVVLWLLQARRCRRGALLLIRPVRRRRRCRRLAAGGTVGGAGSAAVGAGSAAVGAAAGGAVCGVGAAAGSAVCGAVGGAAGVYLCPGEQLSGGRKAVSVPCPGRLLAAVGRRPAGTWTAPRLSARRDTSCVPGATCSKPGGASARERRRTQQPGAPSAMALASRPWGLGGFTVVVCLA